MVMDYEKNILQLKGAIRDYELSTGINCYLLNNEGKGIGDRNCYQCHHICEYIQPFDKSGICTKDYLHSCKPTLQGRRAQTYQCPYGLTNIAVPVLLEDSTVYFVSSGPLLLEPPNKSLLSTFLERNELTKSHSDEVNQMLQYVPLFDHEKIEALGNTLQRSVFPAAAYLLSGTENKEHTLSFLRQELHRDFRLALYPEFIMTASTFQKELDMITPGEQDKSELWQKALEMVLSVFVKEVYRYESFEETRHRAALFFSVMIQTAKNREIDQEQIFGTQYINIEKLLSATSFRTLNPIVYNTRDRFQQAFFQKLKGQSSHLILEAMSYIRQNYVTVTLNDVAKKVALNPSYFSYLFKKHIGQSYSEYLNKVRIDVSKEYLREGVPLSQVAQNAGFFDQSYYIKVFKRFEGVSPNKWKKSI